MPTQRRSTGRRTTVSRRPSARRIARRPRRPINPVVIREALGLASAGFGLLGAASVVLVVAGTTSPLPAVLGSVVLALFGAGWPLVTAAAIVTGAVLMWPAATPPTRGQVAAGAGALLSVLGLLAQVGAGGLAGLLVSAPLARFAGPLGVPILVMALLVSVVLSLRMSLGTGALHVVSAGRAAMGGGNRLVGAGPAFRNTLDALLRAGRRHFAPTAEEAPVTMGPVEAAEAAAAGETAEGTGGDGAPGAALVVHQAEEVSEAEGTGSAVGDPPLPVETVVGEWIVEPTTAWRLPQLTMLEAGTGRQADLRGEVARTSKVIADTLRNFKIDARVIGANSGPSVTRYDITLGPGVRVGKVIAVERDLASALATDRIRIQAVIEGRPGVIGIEAPNATSAMVPVRGVLEAMTRSSAVHILGVALGNDVAGAPVSGDLQRMPHLLVAGATGQGKSVLLNVIICSLLYQITPDRLRMVMIDPKRVELQGYNGLPHLAVPVIVEPHQAAAALRWGVFEMERRYKVLAHEGCRNIGVFNERMAARRLRPLPHVVIVIDELADLMMVAAGEIEELICRIAQLARAVGIHLVIATQRPSTDIITGTIKANFPSRIAFAVGSQVDSRVILDSVGAEKLLGHGDMLYQPVDASKPVRLQGAFISDSEVESLVSFWKGQGEPRYIDEVLEGAVIEGSSEPAGLEERQLDPMFARAARAVAAEGAASVSLVQRKFNVGYSRAGRIVDQLAEHRVVGSYQGSKSREVLMNLPDVDRLLESLGVEG